MRREPYTLDARSADDVYRDAIRLARYYLPEWSLLWPDPATAEGQSYFDPTDPGLVLLKLLSRLHASLATQLNRAPDKHFLAFLSFFGMDLRAPRPAKVVLTFTLAEGNAPVLIAERTQVGAAADPELLFETTGELLALPAELEAACTLLPAADAWIDRGDVLREDVLSEADRVEPQLQPFEHALHLGSEALFKHRIALKELRVRLEGINLFQYFFARWSDGAGRELRPRFGVEPDVAVDEPDQADSPYSPPDCSDTEGDAERYAVIEASFVDFFQASPAEVKGISSFWIAVRPAETVGVRAADAEILPQIFSISVTASSQRQKAEAAYANNTPVDLMMGGRPFGETPAVEDAFYLASEEVFSRAGATVTLEVQAETITPSPSVQLAWEYWTDAGWQPLLTVHDGTNALTQGGTVTFTCPAMDPVSIHGVESRWVRARIAAGGYGSPGQVSVIPPQADALNEWLDKYVADKSAALTDLRTKNINFGVYLPPAYTPPYISSLWLSYELIGRPDTTIAHNAFDVVEMPLGIVAPYRPELEPVSSYSFGFSPASFLRHVLGRTMSLFIVLEEDAPSRGVEQQIDDEIVWEGWDGTAFRPLTVMDRTDGFTTSGLVEIQIPTWITESTRFDKTLVWLRLSAPQREPRWLPRIKRVAPNAVLAENALLWTNQVLGSGTAAPGLVLEFPRKPILDGEVVEVREQVTGQPGTAPAELYAWRRWEKVTTFTFSKADDRHYMLDPTTGELSFGDGIRGMAPPLGENNIRAASYSSGGGAYGNLPPGQLIVLEQAITGVESVTNVLAAKGGMDADDLDTLRRLGPKRLKAMDRAMSAEDFATLALASSPSVGRATAYATGDRLIVAIVPREDTEEPMPASFLIEEVEAYLRARAFFAVADAITVVEPEYVAIDVEVGASLDPGANETDVRARMIGRLSDFFKPLGGEKQPAGWDFRATVTCDMVARGLQGIPRVARIHDVAISRRDPIQRAVITMMDRQLPAAGALRLEVRRGG